MTETLLKEPKIKTMVTGTYSGISTKGHLPTTATSLKQPVFNIHKVQFYYKFDHCLYYHEQGFYLPKYFMKGSMFVTYGLIS